MVALGDIDGSALLNLPVHLESDLSGSATLKPEELGKSYVWKRFRDETRQENPEIEIKSETISVQKLDTLDLLVHVLKIDVEGFEQEVLTGAHQTIVAQKPVLVIEINDPDSWMPWLEKLGYAFFRVDESQAANLIRVNRPGGFINLIALHPDSTSMISKKLFAVAG